jgi:acetyl esterase
MRLFEDGFWLSKALIELGIDSYVPAGADLTDPRLSPLEATDVVGMCPAYVATAGFDPLRDEGEAYADMLRTAGVEVQLRRFDGLIHSFANMVGLGRSAPAAMREVSAALARRLARCEASTRQV